MGMQSQIIGMHSTLDRILTTIQGGITLPATNHAHMHYVSNSNGHSHGNGTPIDRPYSPGPSPGCVDVPNSSLPPFSATRSTTGLDSRYYFPEESHMRGPVDNFPAPSRQQNFPPLPGFAPPVSEKCRNIANPNN